MNPKKYPLLDDFSWLYQQYVVKQNSLLAIGNLVGAKNSNSVRLALSRQKIPLRGRREAQIIGREDDGFVIHPEVLTGCLLGDAALNIWKKESNNSQPYFSKKNKYKEHLEYVASFLFSKNPNARIKEGVEKLIYKGVEKTFPSFLLNSLTHDSLRSWYNVWYPASLNYIKSIPTSIEITPITLLHWFMDDGCCLRQKRPDLKQDLLKIEIASDCFSIEEQNRLLDILYQNFGLRGILIDTERKNKRIAFCRQDDIVSFFNIIGPCPVKCFEYKWKIRQ